MVPWRYQRALSVVWRSSQVASAKRTRLCPSGAECVSGSIVRSQTNERSARPVAPPPRFEVTENSMSTMTPPRLSSRVAGWTAHVVLFGAVVLFALAVNAHYPIQHWLFWRYACYWLLAA